MVRSYQKPARQHVFYQNQNGAGKLSKRWDKTGVVTESRGHDKYSVRVDGSGRILNRNRRYLRSFKPALAQPMLPAASPCREDVSKKGGVKKITVRVI